MGVKGRGGFRRTADQTIDNVTQLSNWRRCLWEERQGLQGIAYSICHEEWEGYSRCSDAFLTVFEGGGRRI